MWGAVGDRRVVVIVDDDAAVREILTAAFEAGGFEARAHGDAASALDGLDRDPSVCCVLLDVVMPGMSGLDALRALNQRGLTAPILMISGSADIPMAVDAIRHGALDFIEKPFDPLRIVTRVSEALTAEAARAAERREGVVANAALGDLLTRREREVLALIAEGLSNKEAGRQLSISPRTIEVHRARIMEKVGARNAADLVRIVMSHTA
ncbi:response regulator transcription factor [Methylopila musalis]|uniref:Response regulator transcription factor n=1 Tax=Methylopila musalis TaxID=1134781 RepID=A0ABW3Z7I1_9HYPH